MLHEKNHFHFFHNKEMDSLYVCLALMHFGEGLISIFIPIYFFVELHYALWQILFFYFLRSLYFVVLVIVLFPLLRKMNDKFMMLVSIPMVIVFFLGLGALDGNVLLFYLLPMLTAAHMLLFNVGYHVSFTSVADEGYIGREVGMRHTITLLTKFAAPFLGGLLIGTFGFRMAFAAGSAILFCAVLPLFFFPRRTLSPHIKLSAVWQYIANKSLRPFNISGFGYGAHTMVGWIVWPLFMYLALGSIEDFGGVISAGLFAGAIITYLTGLLSDAGRRRKMLGWSTGVYAILWALRAALVRPAAIVGNHIVEHVVGSSLIVAWTSQYYSIARSVAFPGLFILSREVIYHASRALFLPLLMLLSVLLPQHPFFMTSFILGSALSLLFFFANKQHVSGLDGAIAKKIALSLFIVLLGGKMV